ncbi:Uncharacterized protein FWK35_00033051, partial [Aphis craccivora]
NLLTDNRRSFKLENIRKHLLLQCNTADPFQIIGDPKLGRDPMVKNRCARLHSPSPFLWRSPLSSDRTYYVPDDEIQRPYLNDAQSFHWSYDPYRDDKVHWKKKILQIFL